MEKLKKLKVIMRKQLIKKKRKRNLLNKEQ